MQLRPPMSLLELNESWKRKRRDMTRRKYWRGGQLGNVYVVLHQLIIADNQTPAEKGMTPPVPGDTDSSSH
jgi:hypothetical protein